MTTWRDLYELAKRAEQVESQYMDLEAIERHQVLPFDQQAAHSEDVNQAYSRWQGVLCTLQRAVLAQGPTPPAEPPEVV
jgi:hypothetical protein